MARQSPYRRYQYDNDLPPSTHMLWLVVVVVFLAVGSFLFGRYVLGERLRQGASPVRNVAQQTPVLQGNPDRPPAPDIAPTATIVSDEEERQEGTEKLAAEAMESASTQGIGAPQATASASESPKSEESPKAERTFPAAEGQDSRERIAADFTSQALQEARRRVEPGARQSLAQRPREEADRSDRSPPKAKLTLSRRVQPEVSEQAKKERPTPSLPSSPPKEKAAPRAPSSSPTPPASGQRSVSLPSQPTKAAEQGTKKAADTTDSEAKKVPSTSESKSPAAPGKLFRLRSGVFVDRRNADRQVEKLRASGHETWIRVTQRNGQTYYEVQVGAYSDKKRADKERAKLAAEGHEVSLSEE